MLRYLVRIALSAWLVVGPAMAADDPIPPLSAIRAQPAQARVNLGIQRQPLSARAPTGNDDVTGLNFPGSGWIQDTPGFPRVLYKNIKSDPGAALWLQEPAPPLFLDTIGPAYLSSAAISNGGASQAVNDIVTFVGGFTVKVTAVTTGTATAITVQNPYAPGWCPVTGNLTQVATTGTGTGLIITPTLAIASGWGRIKASHCWSGNAMTVTNSLSKETLAVPFVAGTNVYDWQAVAAFLHPLNSPAEQGSVATTTTPATAIVTTLNDQGGLFAYNATNTDITGAASTGCVVGLVKLNGNAPPIACLGSQASPVGTLAQFLTIPATVTGSGANYTLGFAGTMTTPTSGFGYLTTGGGNFFGIAQGTTEAYAAQPNAADTGNINTHFNTPVPSTPSVFQISTTGGVQYTDTSLQPALNSAYIVRVSSGTAVVGTQACLAISNGLVGSTPVTICGTAATAADVAALSPNYNTMMALCSAINTNTTGTGVACAPASYYNLGYLYIYTPVGFPLTSAYSFAVSVNGGGITLTTQTAVGSGVGATLAGGAIGKAPFSPSPGNMDFDAAWAVPFPLTPRMLHDLRLSVTYWAGYVPQVGERVFMMCASDCSGYQAAYGAEQSFGSMLPASLNAPDALVFNLTVAGTETMSWEQAFNASNQWVQHTLQVTQLGNGNNIGYVSEVNNDYTTGSYTASLASNGVLTVTVQGSLQLFPGVTMTGAGVSALITGNALIGASCAGSACTGTGGTGTYMTNQTGSTVGSETMTSVGVPQASYNAFLCAPSLLTMCNF